MKLTPRLAAEPKKSLNNYEFNSLEEAIWLAGPDQLDQLEAKASRLLQEDSYSAYAHYLLAELYLKQFKQNPSQLKWLKQASELGQQAIELNPNADSGYIVAAQVLDLMGYSESALGVLEGDSKISLNNSWRIDFLRGQLQSNQIAKDGVIKFFESSLSASNDAKNIVIPYLIATLQSERQGQALVNELAAWQKRFPHRLFQLSLAMALSNSNHYAESHKIYTALQKEYPDFSESFINDAIVLYTHLNQPKLALKLLSLALEVNPQLDNAKKSLVKAHMAKIHLEHTGLYDEARNLFAESIVNAKNPVEWLAFSHKTYEGLHRLHDFVVLLENLRTELPGSSYLYALQGEVLSESLAQHEQAIESFSLAIILDPDRSEFYNGMGLAYYRMQKLDKALLTFHEASKMDPQDATARYNEACVLAIMGRPKEALGSLKEAISLDPGLQKTALLDNDFASIRITEQFRNITSSPITAIQTP